MSLLDSISNLLNIKDSHITYPENFCTEEQIRGVTAKVIHAKLSYKPDACPHCGHVMDSDIIKYGFKASRITLPPISGFNAYLKLSKQRYFCRHCQTTFTQSTPLVDRHCFISKNTKLAIALASEEIACEKSLAKRYNVSHNTVSRIIDGFYLHYRPNKRYLPRHLCFDEFKSVKSAKGAMSFIFCDAQTGKVVDIVEDRRLDSLMKYFMGYSKAARRAVKTIVIDIYQPYISLIKAIFPNAEIIFDRFHIIQLLNRSLNKTRIQLMKEDKKNYNKLKHYWRLLLMDESKIDYIHSRYNRHFRKCMCQIDILEYLLDLDPTLRATYELYQEIKSCVNYRKISRLRYLLEHPDPNLSDSMKTSIKTLLQHFNYVGNALRFPYSNGRIEGLNNKVKVIKRVSYGYRSFYHFRNRILISFGIAKLKAA